MGRKSRPIYLTGQTGYSMCSGPVAQLGARFHGMEEVIGSIPIRSTKLPYILSADDELVSTDQPCAR